MAHLAATAANDSFTEIIDVNLEDVLIDPYYWFDKSSKHKGKLAEYFEFCDQEYQQVLKHVTCRWLSLERCIERALKKFPSLKSYFRSEGFSDARFKRLKDAFSNPLLEPVRLFHNASIQLFTQFNKLLQRSEPTVHVLQTSMLTLAKKIAHRIVKPEVLVSAKPTDVDLNDEEMFIEHQNIYLGGTTKAMLNKLLNEGDITETKYNKFFYAAHCYFKNSLAYILGKFQLREELIQNAVWINIPQRLEAEWQNVEYFYDRFDAIFHEIPVDALFEEFCDYRSLTDNDIGGDAWQAAKVVDAMEGGTEVFHYRVDILWWYIAHMKQPGSSAKRFQHLTRIAEAVLVIPHSNAEEERLFSIVRKNKTDSRPCLGLDGTLSNILAMKLVYPEDMTPCYKFRPSDDLLESSKKAASSYNREHK